MPSALAPQPCGSEITLLLGRIHDGNREAIADLARLALPELRRLASACLREQPSGQTWMPTDLVNELWVRLLRRERFVYQNRAHFLGSCAHLMRALVIDHARARCAGKRWPSGGFPAAVGVHLDFSDVQAAELLDLDEALIRLAAMNSRQAQVVEMRYFAGFTVDETAEAMGLSAKTIRREWAVARSWLHAELVGIPR
jgi:RNA polymerase sigma factor (TIGR02999 family)